MAYENILYQKKDAIAYITFNRPKVLNALNRKTVEELHHALLDADDDASVRVLILTGAGEKSFVAAQRTGCANSREWQRVFAVRPERFPFAGDDGKTVHLCD